MWAGFQAIAGIGAGILYSGLNFPILAPTPPDLNAPALAFLTFARSYGQVFGVTIGGSVMNNQVGSWSTVEYYSGSIAEIRLP